MADQKVNIKISAQGAGKAKKDIGGLDVSIKKLGRSVLNVAGAYFGTQGLINGIMRSAELAGIQEQAEKQLEFALGKTSTALLNQASALQKVTTFGDEAIISQQAFLASLEFSEAQIKDIINASVDLASATGISLESAVRNTAKTFSGLSGELGELIPQLRDLTTEEMKAGEAVKVMADLFGGTAQAQAETLTGKIEQMKNAVGDAGEAIGSLLAPVVISVAGGIASLANATGSLVNNFSDIIDGNSLASAEFELLNTEMEDFKKVTEELGFYSLLEMNNQINDLLSTMPIVTPEVQKLMDQQTILAQAMNEATKEIIRQKEVLDLDDEIEQGERLAESTKNRVIAEMELAKVKQAQVAEDLKNTALGEKSALSAMKTAVRAETMEAIAGYIASVLKGVPFPFNIGLASAGGALIGGIMDTALGAVKAETGFEGVVTKPTLFLTGENNKPEQVSVTPLGGESASGITVNISAPLVDETVVESIIPAIEKAKRMNLA